MIKSIILEDETTKFKPTERIPLPPPPSERGGVLS